MKEYLMLIRENIETYGKMTPEEMQKDIEKHVKWVEKLAKEGHFKSGNPLMPTGKHIKGKSKIITDGPYIESKEGISGYYFLLAKSLDEAAEITKGCPSLEIGATLEIREIINTEKQ
jgi:hypothetical protein